LAPACPPALSAQLLYVQTRVLDLSMRVGAGDLSEAATVGALAALLGQQQEHRPPAEQHPGSEPEHEPDHDQVGRVEGDHPGIASFASSADDP
jgi:hypothetical protein